MAGTIAVYGSARLSADDPVYAESLAVGKSLAAAGYIVMTGGYDGVMAGISQGAADAGGHVIGVTVRQLELIGERLSHETSLLGERFSLEPGARNGRTAVAALRLGQEWVYRTQNQVIAARSRFSFGINALGATINKNGVPDGKFFAWLGQFQ